MCTVIKQVSLLFLYYCYLSIGVSTVDMTDKFNINDEFNISTYTYIPILAFELSSIVFVKWTYVM